MSPSQSNEIKFFHSQGYSCEEIARSTRMELGVVKFVLGKLQNGESIDSGDNEDAVRTKKTKHDLHELTDEAISCVKEVMRSAEVNSPVKLKAALWLIEHAIMLKEPPKDGMVVNNNLQINQSITQSLSMSEKAKQEALGQTKKIIEVVSKTAS